MADVVSETARRREIRRRKILDNTEARWKKIVGNEDLPIQKSEVETTSYAPVAEVTSVNENDVDDRSKAESIGSRLSFGSERSSPLGGSFDSITEDDGSNNVNGTLKRRTSASGAYAFPKKVSDAENRTYCRSDSHRSNSCTRLVLDTLQIDELNLANVRSWIVLLVAAIIRFLVSFGQNALYTKSIIVPFFLLESAFIAYELLVQKVPRCGGGAPSLLGAALLLSGVPLSVASKICRPVNALLDALKDLSVYLFCFTLFHVLYKLC